MRNSYNDKGAISLDVHTPDVNALAAHGLSLRQLVGILQEERQVVEAASSQRVI